MHNLSFTSTASSLSDVPSLGFDTDLLDCQLKSTSGDPSLDLGTTVCMLSVMLLERTMQSVCLQNGILLILVGVCKI